MKWKLTPLLLLEGLKTFLLPWELDWEPEEHHLMTQERSDINTYLPMELLREIFLYGIEGNQTKSGQLASVCRHWRSVITSIASLWSTLRVGDWTDREQVATWLQRAYPKKVVIDIQGYYENPYFSSTAALQDTLISTSQWHELTISSVPPVNFITQLDFHVASQMNELKVLHVAAGCVHTPSFADLLHLVPTEAPLSELRLHSSFASTHFLQSRWFPVLKNLTVLIVDTRDIHEPFELLPTFTQLQTLEANRLPLPMYEHNANLPLLCTLQKLRLRASSVQWMAGRVFPCLEECAILLPQHWAAVQQLAVQLPSCRKLTYHGFPMTAVQYFHAPQLTAMGLESHDCMEQRVYRQLHNLCTTGERISKVTTLHLTLRCSERVFIRVLKYLGPLQELVLSLAYPSPSWQDFLESLAAKPSRKDRPEWKRLDGHQEWEEWCSSQTWHVNILPHLKYLGIQCPKGFSQSECLDNSPSLRHVGWTRAQLSPPLEHLKVWERRGAKKNVVVDYISADYSSTHLETRNQMLNGRYDSAIVRGMVTQHLVIDLVQLLNFHSTPLFRRLQVLQIQFGVAQRIPILPYLEQIKRLIICHGIIPAYSLDVELPLVHTLQRLGLECSTFSWMLGRTFMALREFQLGEPYSLSEQSGLEELQMDLPACTTLRLGDISANHLRCLSCTNVQILQLQQSPVWSTTDKAALESLHDFLYNRSYLRKLDILISQDLGLDPLIQFIFCDALKQRVWRDIRSVELRVWYPSPSSYYGCHFFTQMVGQNLDYEKQWKEFAVTKDDASRMVIITAST